MSALDGQPCLLTFQRDATAYGDAGSTITHGWDFFTSDAQIARALASSPTGACRRNSCPAEC